MKEIKAIEKKFADECWEKDFSPSKFINEFIKKFKYSNEKLFKNYEEAY